LNLLLINEAQKTYKKYISKKLFKQLYLTVITFLYIFCTLEIS